MSSLFKRKLWVIVVQLLSHVTPFLTPWIASIACPSRSPWVCSNSGPLSWWCRRAISSSITRFPSCPQSFPASGSFLVNQLFASGDQSIGASASASVLPVNIQGWFPSGLTGLISLLSKGFSRVFSSSTVWKHQFFHAQPSFLVQLSHGSLIEIKWWGARKVRTS